MWISHFIIGLSIYCIVNGLLHDIFVLQRHTGGYNRDLLRLLMDGHILLTCGVVYLFAWFMFKEDPAYALGLCIIVATSLIIYCLMIFPFLKSIFTLVLNLAMVISAILMLL